MSQRRRSFLSSKSKAKKHMRQRSLLKAYTDLQVSSSHSVVPHHLHHTHYFASKRNVLNTLFVKRAWAWTSALVALNTLLNPSKGAIRFSYLRVC